MLFCYQGVECSGYSTRISTPTKFKKGFNWDLDVTSILSTDAPWKTRKKEGTEIGIWGWASGWQLCEEERRRTKGIAFPLLQQSLLQQLWLTHPLYSRLTRLETPSPPLAVCRIVLTSVRCWIHLLLMGVWMLMSTGLSRAGQVKQVKHLPPLLIFCVWEWQQIQTAI